MALASAAGMRSQPVAMSVVDLLQPFRGALTKEVSHVIRQGSECIGGEVCKSCDQSQWRGSNVRQRTSSWVDGEGRSKEDVI